MMPVDEDELPPLDDVSEVDPLDQMAGEPEDEDFFEATENMLEDDASGAGRDGPVPGMVRALREQFEQVREPRVSTASTISSAALQADHEVLVLSLKPSFKSQKGRELDPRFFSATEKAQFDKADTANWQKHLNLGAVGGAYPPDASTNGASSTGAVREDGYERRVGRLRGEKPSGAAKASTGERCQVRP